MADDKKYDAMKKDLFEFLSSAINTMASGDIKVRLIGNVHNKKIEEMIKATPSDDAEMMGLFKSLFSLSNVAALKSLVQDQDPIAKNFNLLLKKQNQFYESILAKDFAKKAIEDHQETNETNATVSKFDLFA